MKILKSKTVNILVLFLGLVLALTPFVIAPVCPPMANGMRMSCYYSGLLATGAGIGIIITSINILRTNMPIVTFIIFHCHILYLLSTKGQMAI